METKLENKSYSHHSILLSELLTHKQFGANATYHWPFNKNDAAYVVRGAWTIKGTSSEEIIECVESSGDYVEDFLTPEGFKIDPKNIVDQIVYNNDNLIIKEWLAGTIITSAVLCLMEEQLNNWKRAYDRRKTFTETEYIKYTREAYYTPYNKSPVLFSSPIEWENLLDLCVNPYVGPILGEVLKDFSLVTDNNTSIKIISSLIKANPSGIYYDNYSFVKQGVINFLTLFNINKATMQQLAEDVFASKNFCVLIVFLTNYKLKKENDEKM
jgi:hypothetical protein